MLEIVLAIVVGALMLVPMVNVVVGALAGFVLWGWLGAIGGALAGFAIMGSYSGH